VALDQRSRTRIAESTAEGAAALRAAGSHERDEAVRNPDFLASRFIAPRLSLTTFAKLPGSGRLVRAVAELRMPGSYYFEIARTRHMDDVVRAEVAAGVGQLVVLGAGYDSRAYRMPELEAVRTFEVDHPITSGLKRKRLEAVFGEVPRHVVYVQVDFIREDLGERLSAAGYDDTEPALFVLSGVAPYLPEAAVRETLGWVARQAPGSSILFDYLWSEVFDDAASFYGVSELLRRVAEMGEKLRSGIPRGTTHAYLAELGLELENDIGPEDAKRYLTASDGRVIGRPYGFGGIAHARVPARGSERSSTQP
jgi:methyltransferase (TIGR00027 family)